MAVSVFDLFSIGVGPSSSHTVGPMRAARRFLKKARESRVWDDVSGVKVELFGSLAMTGKGHQTDRALLMGLEGRRPSQVEPEMMEQRIAEMDEEKTLLLLGEKKISFDRRKDLVFCKGRRLPFHSNGMRFTVVSGAGEPLIEEVYYSVGGGFILDEVQIKNEHLTENGDQVPYPFKTGAELTQWCRRDDLSIAEVVMSNEKVWKREGEIASGLLEIWKVMKESALKGCRSEGILPGGLGVKRRAPGLYRDVVEGKKEMEWGPGKTMDWVSAWAIAVNEENAAGGRVVTAPTNGAAGIIPSVLMYYEQFWPGASDQGIIEFLLVAGAVGILYKEGASISAAEVGCQGEVGVGCSMAAAGLAAVMGGTTDQICNAAEIGMEHNLGLTCDPIKGLVQVPCIERNAMGAIKAINAARLAMRGEGDPVVSLDTVIKTMRQTGRDMQSIYKETSEGGLAVNMPEC